MKISKRDKVALAIGGGALALAAIYMFIVIPVHEGFQDVKSEIVKKSELLPRYERLWESRSEVEKKLKRIESRYRGLQKMLLKGENQSLAAAELQKTLEDFSAKCGVGIASSKVLGSKSHGSFEEVSIQLGIKSSLRNLQDFLYHVESSRKFLTVREINILVFEAKELERLDARIKVSGYIKSEQEE